MLENALYLGFAGFFFLAGRGPISVDRFAVPVLEPPAHLMKHAMTALRIGLGVSLTVVAFTEKLANIPLAQGFLQQYPLNFTTALGIPMSNELFILCAGSIELLVGLLFLFGIFPREIVLIAWVPINMTLTILTGQSWSVTCRFTARCRCCCCGRRAVRTCACGWKACAAARAHFAAQG
jgi:uncharacterized membrane protein YphA (DoxX/SURF4 family)